MNRTGEKIKFLRQRKHMTQQQLGDEVGYSWQAISSIEIGRNSCKAPKLNKIARVLDTTVEYLLDDTKDDQIYHSHPNSVTAVKPYLTGAVKTSKVAELIQQKKIKSYFKTTHNGILHSDRRNGLYVPLNSEEVPE